MSAIRKQFAAEAVSVVDGDAASPAAFRGAAPERFSVIHFTSHAVANTESPLDSAVILSGPDQAYKLYARDVAALPLKAELVTVSACRSAGERAYAGEGLVGFAWAFLRAGSRRVVAGLWDVDDRSTAALMEEIYARIAAGASPPVALREAKRADQERLRQALLLGAIPDVHRRDLTFAAAAPEAYRRSEGEALPHCSPATVSPLTSVPCGIDVSPRPSRFGARPMPEPIARLTLAQFQLLLPDRHALTREIRAVHLHHTWKPERADFRGLRTIEGMRNFHLEQGWEDIAQHLTVDPAGGLWTGRNWNRPPASSRGHNGTTAAGPFMIEMVGNFDTGHDAFDGEQRESALEVVAHLLRVFGLSVADIRLHRELNQGGKTCPGSGIDRDDIERDVQKRLRRKAPAATRLFAREHLLGYDVTRPAPAPVRGLDGVEVDATVPENDAAAAAVDVRTRRAVAAAQRAARYSRDLSQLVGAERTRGEDWSMLKPHVVNLSRGELSEGGAFATSPADLDNIVDAIRDRAASVADLKVLLYAHGGLVGESDALGYARQMHRWWLERGVYPIFFIWESGLLEILRQYVVGPRDIFDFTTDPAIEVAAKPLGTLAWSGMKDSARRASAADLGEGFPGGAHLFAGKLASLAGEFQGLTFHAVGHSAGAIFQAHFVPALLAQGVARVASLSLLAPACRTELFKDGLLPLVNDGRVQRHHLFTMEEEAERQDDTFTVYRKSLLYLVSHAFEGGVRRPILGLHRSIRRDAVLSALYGIGQPGAANVEVQFSFARDKAENPLTRSVTHGGFDNDPKTMSAVLRRILGVPDDSGVRRGRVPIPAARAGISAPVGAAARGSEPGGRQPTGTAPAIQVASEGRRMALCIGIDRYRDRPLAGCVNDARAWGRSLAALGFDVRYLLDEQATQAGMLDGLRTLMGGARAGDVLVLQYSGSRHPAAGRQRGRR